MKFSTLFLMTLSLVTASAQAQITTPTPSELDQKIAIRSHLFLAWDSLVSRAMIAKNHEETDLYNNDVNWIPFKSELINTINAKIVALGGTAVNPDGFPAPGKATAAAPTTNDQKFLSLYNRYQTLVERAKVAAKNRQLDQFSNDQSFAADVYFKLKKLNDEVTAAGSKAYPPLERFPSFETIAKQ